MAEHAAAAASFVCLLDLRVTHARRGRREAGISLSPLELGVRMLSAISAFCHDELPNTFITSSLANHQHLEVESVP